MKKIIILIGNDPYLSGKVQEILFKAGFGWCRKDYTVGYTHKPILFVEDDGCITHCTRDISHICEDYSKGTYILYKGEEITLELALTFEGAKKPVVVKEMTMEELNALSEKNFGYQIKIRK